LTTTAWQEDIKERIRLALSNIKVKEICDDGSHYFPNKRLRETKSVYMEQPISFKCFCQKVNSIVNHINKRDKITKGTYVMYVMEFYTLRLMESIDINIF